MMTDATDGAVAAVRDGAGPTASEPPAQWVRECCVAGAVRTQELCRERRVLRDALEKIADGRPRKTPPGELARRALADADLLARDHGWTVSGVLHWLRRDR